MNLLKIRAAISVNKCTDNPVLARCYLGTKMGTPANVDASKIPILMKNIVPNTFAMTTVIVMAVARFTLKRF